LERLITPVIAAANSIAALIAALHRPCSPPTSPPPSNILQSYCRAYVQGGF